MQPTYLPWMGYFDLIDQSDLFVFLDNVQFEKQSWQQRNRIKTAQGPLWLTVPVYQRLGQKIVDVRINSKGGWKRKHRMSLHVNYNKSSFWPMFSPIFEKIYQQEWDFLVELNIHLIELICQKLKVEYNFIRTSQLESAHGKNVDLLISICQSVGADIYLSPAGSKTYLTSNQSFKKKRILLKYHQYEHPTHPQLYGDFISHLSVVDVLFNKGPQAKNIILSGRKAV